MGDAVLIRQHRNTRVSALPAAVAPTQPYWCTCAPERGGTQSQRTAADENAQLQTKMQQELLTYSSSCMLLMSPVDL